MRKLLILFFGSVFLFIGCTSTTADLIKNKMTVLATKQLEMDLAKDENIKFIKVYKDTDVGVWKKTDVIIYMGDAVIIVPLYPKGFLYSVQGKVGEMGRPFDGLDADIGKIYTAQNEGVLHLGIDMAADTLDAKIVRLLRLHTGIFIFKTDNLDNIISDLTHIQINNKDSKMINITLGLLLKRQADLIIAQNKQAEALTVLDKSISHLELANEKLYSRTIYQLYSRESDHLQKQPRSVIL